MRLKTCNFCMFSIFCFCCVSVFAETKIPVVVNIGHAGQLGYKWPVVSVSAGLESYHENHWSHVTGKFSPTDKISYGDVTRYGVTGEIFWKSRRGLFIGGGGTLRNIRFHDLGPGQSYWTYGPTVAGGWLKDGTRIILRGHVYEHDVRYDFYGLSWTITHDIKARIRLGAEQGFYKVGPKGSGQRLGNAFVSSVVVGFVF